VTDVEAYKPFAGSVSRNTPCQFHRVFSWLPFAQPDQLHTLVYLYLV